MKWLLPFFLLLTFSCLNPLFAETITVSGDVSGTWSADTVLVQDEIRIPQNEMLIIDSGIRVIFEGHYKFIVDTGAVLQALGTESDSIFFQASDPDSGWHGIRFSYAGETCAFFYCSVRDGYAFEEDILYEDRNGGALYLLNTTLNLRHCSFTQNRTEKKGGGIYAADQSAILIRRCHFIANIGIYNGNTLSGGAIYANETVLQLYESNFSENFIGITQGGYNGGAVCCNEGELIIDKCTFLNNEAHRVYGGNASGGAIAANGSVVEITNCYFEGNMAPEGSGGAVYCSDETVIINCEFFENYSQRGGGVSCHGHAIIDHCTFYGNATEWEGAAISSGFQTDVSLINSTICRNVTGYEGVIYTGNYAAVNIRNTIFEGNVNYAIFVNGLTTYRIDYCSFYNNQGGDFTSPGVPLIGTIFEDPRLSDPDNRDFTLLPASPCIDLGDPNLPPDPDDSRSDIGAFYYDHRRQVGIRGECTLSNLTTHQGSKIYFSETGGGALIDSSQTFNNGKFRLFVDPGIYDILFTHFGYNPVELLNQNCTEPITLPAVNLAYSTQSIHISGGLSGLLETADYIADDNLRVPPGDSLIIEPGTTIYFDGDYKFEVHGYLSAYGTEEDSIFFLPAVGVDHWQGIDFLPEASDSNRLEYCLITGSWSSGVESDEADINMVGCTVINNSAISGGGGIRCFNCTIGIFNCVIQNNVAMVYPQIGGGLYCLDADCFIEYSVFSGNYSMLSGGGINIVNGTHLINDCLVENNITDGGGGGIILDNSSGIIINTSITNNIAGVAGGIWGPDTLRYCEISQNSASDWAGGIQTDDGSAFIEHCVISENCTQGYAAGVLLDDNWPVLKNCLIVYNYAESFGGGVYVGYTSDPRILNCTIAHNIADYRDGGFAIAEGNSPVITNCIHWWNTPPTIYQGFITPPTPIVGYCTFEDTLFSGPGNMTDDPLFVDPMSNDFHLQSITGSYHGGAWLPDPNHSPCIDSGDPTSAFIFEPVPNGERINMGAYGNTPEASLSAIDLAVQQEAMLPSANYLDANYPNPFNPMTTIRYGLSRTSNVKITIYDVTGRLVTTLIDGYRDAGFHEVTWDASNLASGLYIYRLEAGQFSASGKMVLMK